ncbi:hypothetical protein [Burkholderia multivorans]|uniref:hypothetical protein n=1 Tax=Burkholderia multivorans TaxID=87883 RepID=UPI000753876E|nr:hypothetical protein [Burkholderia multivorans]KWH21028.1 hypothetical protein WL98_18170 [Burkholderia multivorans]
MPKHTTLIDATIDRLDTNLIRVDAGDKRVQLYRLTMQDRCYFVAANDVDVQAFEQIALLQPGMPVRACVFGDRGRRRIAWIRGSELSISPYDASGRRKRNLSLLTWASCVFMLSMLMCISAFRSGWALVVALTLFVNIVSLLGTLVALTGLSEWVLRPQRREAQEMWQREPSRFTFERSNA